jgi:hypothetical protein
MQNLTMWIAIFLATMLLIALVARVEWLRLRPKINARPAEVQELEKPGVLSERLDEARWSKAFRSTLERAAAQLRQQAAEHQGPAKSAVAMLQSPWLAEPGFVAVSRDVVLAALQSGELQSVLVKGNEAAVYLLAFPGRHEHSRAFRRYAPFTFGWAAHVKLLRNELRRQGVTTPLLALLYFLNPQAQDGMLAVAYEADDSHLLPGELGDEVTANGTAPVRSEMCSFSMV